MRHCGCNHLLELTDSFRPSKEVLNFNPLAIAETPASRMEFAFTENIIKLVNSIWREKQSKIPQCVGAVVIRSLRVLFPSLEQQFHLTHSTETLLIKQRKCLGKRQRTLINNNSKLWLVFRCSAKAQPVWKPSLFDWTEGNEESERRVERDSNRKVNKTQCFVDLNRFGQD